MLTNQPTHRFSLSNPPFSSIFSILLALPPLLLLLSVGSAVAAAEPENVFWFRGGQPQADFYTISVEERNRLFESHSHYWHYQGVPWAAYPDASVAGAKPVYQFFRQSAPGFFFTISEIEKDKLINREPDWVYHGIAWYAYDYPQAGTLAVYQVSLPRRSAPFYTVLNEGVEAFLTANPSAIIEGIAWYAYPANEYTNPVQMEPVSGGCFDLGNQGYGVPWVCINDFQMGRYEVTQGLWQAIMGANPSRWFYDCRDCPVENLTWHETQVFIERLNQLTNRNYRLPTEAEWEYACRSGGLNQTYCGGEDINDLAWYDLNADGFPHEVGGKMPNALGLFDMSGNVMEWTCSAFNPGYFNPYGKDALECGLQVSRGYRVARGGSWAQIDTEASSTYRFKLTPATQSPNIGLRLAHD